MSAREQLSGFSKERFDELKSAYERAGYKVLTRWRKGCKLIRLADIVLSEQKESIPTLGADSVSNGRESDTASSNSKTFSNPSSPISTEAYGT